MHHPDENLNCFKLRVPDEFPSNEIREVLEKRYLKQFVRVFEIGKKNERPHFHYYVETDIKGRTVRAFIRDKCGFKGNYSLTECDFRAPEYLSYLWKDQHMRSTLFSTFADEIDFLEIARLDSLRVQEEIKKKKVAKQPVWKQCMFYIEEWLKTCNQSERWFNNCAWNYENVTARVVDFMLERDIVLRDFQIKCVVRTIVVKKNPMGAKQDFIRLICSDLQRQPFR